MINDGSTECSVNSSNTLFLAILQQQRTFRHKKKKKSSEQTHTQL